jgi:N-acetylglucosamine-6-sulfatase
MLGVALRQRPSTCSRLGVAALLVVTCLAAALAVPGADAREEARRGLLAAAPDPRPNIVLVLADDMRASELRWMSQVRRLVGDPGVQLQGMLSNHPVCCPARAELLTGQYAQNNGVHHNTGSFGGFEALRFPGNHVGAWLRNSGYTTGLVGKFLNRWELDPVLQPGWTTFDPILARIYVPYGLTMYADGDPETFPDVYTTTVVGARAADFVRSHAGEDAPFFLWVNQVPPHDMKVRNRWGPPQPEPQHADDFPISTSPSIAHPAFDEEDVSDKPEWVQALPRYPARTSTTWHRARIRSLQSVDDQVAALVDALEETGELANTYVVFTSDNGYLLGEHRYAGKNVAYEDALHVPFLVRGPGLPQGVVRRATFELVDVVPTLLRLAGAKATRLLDGRSMLPALRRGAEGKRFSLIQAGVPNEPWWWRGVRSDRYKYVRYESGFEELYDLRRDPGELRNVAMRPRYATVRAAYAAKLDALKACRGASCVAETS